MPYMSCIGECVRCHQPFTFNPNLVLSIRLTPDGPREPICRECVEYANALREKTGAPRIVPLPGAYDPEEC